jgi:hypothetical protein
MNMVILAITMVVVFMTMFMFMVGMLQLLACPCLGNVMVVMVYMA